MASFGNEFRYPSDSSGKHQPYRLTVSPLLMEGANSEFGSHFCVFAGPTTWFGFLVGVPCKPKKKGGPSPTEHEPLVCETLGPGCQWFKLHGSSRFLQEGLA